MENVFLAIGAYGRTANKEDWAAGKDFKMWNGPYFSVRDTAKLRDDGYTAIWFMADGDRSPLFSVDLGA